MLQGWLRYLRVIVSKWVVWNRDFQVLRREDILEIWH